MEASQKITQEKQKRKHDSGVETKTRCGDNREEEHCAGNAGQPLPQNDAKTRQSRKWL